jgi:Uncharacterized enzyme involved in biosynthesis of extracellular polysaccharides
MIKVVLSRQIKANTETKLVEALMDLRAAALHQPGYITGETLMNTADPHNILVISTWISLEHWKAWKESEQRIELDEALMPLLSSEEQVSTYYVVGREM